MSLVLQRLERDGQITRTTHPGDRRKVVVTATSDSTARAMTLLQPVIAGIAEIVERLTPDQRSTVSRFLDDLNCLYAAITKPQHD